MPHKLLRPNDREYIQDPMSIHKTYDNSMDKIKTIDSMYYGKNDPSR